ncbi:MAG: peptide chain release factor 1 [Clostridiales bacterium]|jgi:peptide chain release factor 1|nr:peptide chain release factor 1 [Clostridiales bacterium]
MFDKLEAQKIRYEFLSEEIGKPQVIADQKEWKKLVVERSALEETVLKYYEYLKLKAEIDECESLVAASKGDAELEAAALEESGALSEKAENVVDALKALLIPKDPNDGKNVIVEIRAGAGGDEAGLFGTELMRMYKRYAERMRWKVEDIDINDTELGGIKEAVFVINSKSAYNKLKYESGVHRVQRVPETESQGRVHTSTVTVAILPEVSEVEVEINEKDLKIDTYRSSGAGGQHVNKTESAIRITHLPTNTVVTCQDEKSQIKNRERAMKVLYSRLYEISRQNADKDYSEKRKSQVGTGDRSEKIRTYNFPQGRVTDHRINMSVFSIDVFMDGDIGSMLEALQIADRNEKLTGGNE